MSDTHDTTQRFLDQQDITPNPKAADLAEAIELGDTEEIDYYLKDTALGRAHNHQVKSKLLSVIGLVPDDEIIALVKSFRI